MSTVEGAYAIKGEEEIQAFLEVMEKTLWDRDSPDPKARIHALFGVLMEGVLWGIANGCFNDPEKAARAALQGIEFAFPERVISGEPTRYRIVGVDDRELAPTVCREANGLIVTDIVIHGDGCRCIFLTLQDDGG